MRVKLWSCLIALVVIIFPVFEASALVSSESDLELASVVILQVQTQSLHSASEEMILLFNAAAENVQVTNWCVSYASKSSATYRKLSCFDVTGNNVELWLEPGGIISLSTDKFNVANPEFSGDYLFSSGLAGAGGHLKLVDGLGQEVDRVGWGSALYPELLAAPLPDPGEVITRDLESESIDTDNNLIDFSSSQAIRIVVSGMYEVEIPVDVCANIDGLQLAAPEGTMINEEGSCIVDVCPGIEGLQPKVPGGYEVIDQHCALIPLVAAVLSITEVYPNAPSVDDGKEFIEIFNPGSESVLLSGYKIDLGENEKSFIFEEGEIKPSEFLSFSDVFTGIVLPNSNAALRLIAPFGNIVSEVPEYENPKDTSSWAEIDGTWEFTNQITPAAANLPNQVSPPAEEIAEPTASTEKAALASCGAGRYRSAETNRCRNIVAQTTTLKSCAAGEYRNPSTNRCRKTVAAASSLSMCPEGKERNPDTNRCRNAPQALLGVTELADINEVTVKSKDGSFDWPLVSVALLMTILYMLYEWRIELHRYYRFNLRSTS